MTELVLGPILRHVDETRATIWVETDTSCTVEILGHRENTFHVAGHHYALICIEDLRPGSTNEYTVTLDGELHWPRAGSEFPASAIRTSSSNGPARVVFGSCRLTAPHGPPYT